MALPQTEARARRALSRAALRWAADARKGVTSADVERAVDEGRADALLDAWVAAAPVFGRVYGRVGPVLALDVEATERRRIERRRGRTARLAAADGALPDLPESADQARSREWLVTHRASLVREITDQTREGLAAAIDHAVAAGVKRKDLSKLIKPQIGLLARDALAVERLRSTGASGAAVARYAARLLDRRAENIGRTETIAIQGAAQEAEWEAAVEDGLLDSDQERRWVANSGACEHCKELDGQTAPLGQPFESSKYSNVRRQPLHPSCTCSVVLAF